MERRREKILELKFNTKIYSKEAIRKAISDYSYLANFSIVNSKGYAKVRINTFEPKAKNFILLADEFTNYVLGLTKKCIQNLKK